jgi:sec-independent protein translocase protein TatB
VVNFPGPEKILLLAVIALVVLGPTRLPQAARTAGKWVAELRKLTSRLQDEVSGALSEPHDALTAAVGGLRDEVGGWRNQVSGLGRSMTAASGLAGASGVTPAGSEPVTSTYLPPISGGDEMSLGAAPPGFGPMPPPPDDPSLN